MTVERGKITTDLLSLSGLDALEALHDMLENGAHTKIGDFILKKIVSTGFDTETADMVFSALTVTEQSVIFSFSPTAESAKPMINETLLVIGPDRTE